MQNKVDFEPDADKARLDLPLPRLQLRWRIAKADEIGDWVCHYELVVPMRDIDCRNNEGKKAFVIELGCTRSSGQRDWNAVDYQAPFRDGVHARWDAEHLGRPPIFVIAPDGRAALMHIHHHE